MARLQLTGHETEHRQRGLVGIVQIVEHDQHRMRAGPYFQEVGDRIEEAKTRLGWIDIVVNRRAGGQLRQAQIRNDLS